MNQFNEKKRDEKIYSKYSIIIPVRSYNKLLKECIFKILNISKKIEIIIVYDDINFVSQISADFRKYVNFEIKLIKSKKQTISAKRNLAVNHSEKEFFAFIDSDAYPSIDWIYKADLLFKSNKNIYCVGGPNISPDVQSYFNSAVGFAQKSFLVSGIWNYHKKIGSCKFASHIPSCNMIVRADIYKKYNGMDENIYTGEDLDFCTKINDNKKRIFFDSKVIVYHHDRNVKNYIYQKLFRGSAVFENFRTQNFYNNFFLFAPSFFFLFNVVGVVSLVFAISNIINLFFMTTFGFYIFICFIEALRYSRISNLIVVFYLLFISSYLVGIGTILKLININISNKYYKNN